MEVEVVKKIAAAQGKKVHFIGKKSTQVKWINGIKNNKKANPENYFVIEGIWLHQQAYNSQLEVHSFIICPSLVYSSEGEELVEKYIALAENIYLMLSEATFLKMSEKDSPHGLMSVCRYHRYTLNELQLGQNNLLVILDGLEIPGNVGTIVRTVDGAGGDAVVVVKKQGSARLNHPKLIRASQCTCFNIPMIEVAEEDLLAWLKKNKFTIYLLDPKENSREYHEYSYQGRVAMVAGNERHGISAAWYQQKHKKLFIPMLGQIDSLNVGIAASIVIYEASLKQKGHLIR